MKQTKNLTPEEKKEWILQNCIDHKGDIDLMDLDFRDVNANVFLNWMKVKRSIYQTDQEAGSDIIQSYQKAGGDIIQYNQKAGGSVYQKNQRD